MEMDAMIRELGDDHSFFLSPFEVEASEAELKGDNEFVGLGITWRLDFERERMIVISTYPGSPAEYGGIQEHDGILLVDGLPSTTILPTICRAPNVRCCAHSAIAWRSPGT
jgi:C-terminal processing protease CtpA/Prc